MGLRDDQGQTVAAVRPCCYNWPDKVVQVPERVEVIYIRPVALKG